MEFRIGENASQRHGTLPVSGRSSTATEWPQNSPKTKSTFLEQLHANQIALGESRHGLADLSPIREVETGTDNTIVTFRDLAGAFEPFSQVRGDERRSEAQILAASAEVKTLALREALIEKLTAENAMLKGQISRQGEILLNAAKHDGGRLMPAQMSQILTM